MKTIKARNVDEALYLGVDFFRGPEGINYRKQEKQKWNNKRVYWPCSYALHETLGTCFISERTRCKSFLSFVRSYLDVSRI